MTYEEWLANQEQKYKFPRFSYYESLLIRRVLSDYLQRLDTELISMPDCPQLCRCGRHDIRVTKEQEKEDLTKILRRLRTER